MTISHDVINILSKIFACYNLLLILVGFVLNPLVAIICLKGNRLRTKSTFKILAVGAVNDMLVCIARNHEGFTTTFFNYSGVYVSLLFCRWISIFLQYTTIQLESWILLSIRVDRLLSLVVRKWTRFYFIGCRPFIYTFLLYFLIVLINIHGGINGGYSYYDNETQKDVIVCYATNPEVGFDWYRFESQVFLYFGFLVPAGLLVIVNMLIIFKATRSLRQQITIDFNYPNTIRRSSKKKIQMTKTILFITFLYIVLTLPNIILAGYFFVLIMGFSWGQLFVNIINSVQFSYPAFNFFILLFSNKKFSAEVKSTFSAISSCFVLSNLCRYFTNSDTRSSELAPNN